MLLAYPDGRLSTRRRPAGASPPTRWRSRPAAGAAVLAATRPMGRRCDDCPPSAFMVADDDDLASALDVATSALALVLVGYVLTSSCSAGGRPRERSAARWRRCCGRDRLLVAARGADLGRAVAGPDASSAVNDGCSPRRLRLTPYGVPVRSAALARPCGGAVSSCCAGWETRRAAGCATCSAPRSATARCGRLLARGQAPLGRRGRPPGALPADDDPAARGRAVEREGRRVGAIVHDRSLCDEPASWSARWPRRRPGAGERAPGGELRARVEELRTSRARIVEAGTPSAAGSSATSTTAPSSGSSRSLTLRLAQASCQGPRGRRALLAGAQEELEHALDELRELARGIHPAVLSDRGPRAGARGARRPLAGPGRVVRTPRERLPAAVEAAAYFVVAEALTNVAKYAAPRGPPCASRARQRPRGRRGRRRRRRRGRPGPRLRPARAGRPRRRARRTPRARGLAHRSGGHPASC